MINILIPLAGGSLFFDETEYPYPKPLVEINGKPMIQKVIENYNSLTQEKQFVFVVNKNDCIKYHLDSIQRLLTDNKCKIINLERETKGAACSCLMAIEHINNCNELIIANGDQVVDINYTAVIDDFRTQKSDAGVICFESVHPKWSYIRMDDSGEVIETAEKNPISKNAIAGFYYFREGKSFIKAAKDSIEKESSLNGIFYIAPTLNELILDNRKLTAYKIQSNQYHSFYSPQKIKEYENTCGFGSSPI